MTAVPQPTLAAPQSPGVGSRWVRGDVVALVLCLLVALGFRSFGLFTPAISVDEVWHLALTRGEGSPVGAYADDVAYVGVPSIATLHGARPAWRVWTTLDGVLHPPLYLLTLRLWREAFGASIAAAQSLSIVWSLIGIGFAFAAARLAMGRAAAIWVALLVGVAPLQIYFALEVRGYAMMIGLGSVALWLATRIEVLGQTSRRSVALALVALPLLLTHYFSAGAALGMAAYALVRLRGRPRRAFFVATAAAAAIYAVAWLPFAIRQLDAIESGDAFTQIDDVDLARELRWAAAVPSRMFLEKPWMSESTGGLTAAAFGGVLFVAPWLLRRRLPAMVPWACWLAAGIALIVVLDVSRSTFLAMFVRYVGIASPAVALLLVAVVRSAAGRRAMSVVCAAAVAAMLLVRPVNGGAVNDAPSFAGMAGWLASNVAPGDGLLVIQGTAGPHTADLVVMTLAHQPGLLPRTIAKVTGPLPAETLGALPDRVWAVMVDPDKTRLARALGGAKWIASYGIPGEGICNLYDLTDAKAAAATSQRTTDAPVPTKSD